jgi:alpha-glucosidase
VIHERAGRVITCDYGGPRLALSVLSPQLVRVRLAAEGAFAPRRSWAVTRADDDFAPVDVAVREAADALVVDTGAFEITVARGEARIACADPAGRPFCVDLEPAGGRAAHKRIEPGEHFYGCGERTGLLDRLGQRLTNWTTDPVHHSPGTDPLYMAIPVCLALRPGLAYGLYLNNTFKSCFDIGASRSGVWSLEADDGELDYYVAYGPTPAEVLSALAGLLGHMPLPPRWALGYHQSRWSYMSADEVREVARTFRGRRLPCDVLHLDIDYMRGYRVFSWDPERFPDPAALLAELRAAGFRGVAIVDPGVKVDSDYEVYADGLAQDAFVRRADGEVFHGFVWPDEAVFPDFLRPDVRAWWAGWQREFVAAGLSGIWNDMNEPAVFSAPFSSGFSSVGTIDLDAVQGPPDERAAHGEVHNLYGQSMARASYEGLVRDLGGERPFVLTRSGFAGLQRWSAGWMGDNHSWWEHLEMAIPQLLNMGLSGVPFVGTDIGGFGGNASGELFARWMQFGALSPFCRAHSAMGTERHEPWVFGSPVEAICRQYLALRYRLLPYLYSLFWEASTTGAPVLRPLLYHFPDDPATYALHDECLLGPALLAAPVYQPGREHRHVYLPAGSWTDWWTGEVIHGPRHFLAEAPLATLPLYARGGAIIPLGPALQFADERPLDPLTLEIFPGEGAFTLYEDDGHSLAHQRGEWCTTRYRVALDGGDLVLELGARAGRYIPPPRDLILRVHGLSERAVAGHPGAHYDEAGRVLTLGLGAGGDARQLRFRGA